MKGDRASQKALLRAFILSDLKDARRAMLSANQLALFAEVKRRDAFGTTTGWLMSETGTTLQTCTKRLADLYNKGYLTREESNSVDGKLMYVYRVEPTLMMLLE